VLRLRKLLFAILKGGLTIFIVGILGCFVLDLITPIFNPQSRPLGHVRAVFENILYFVLMCLAGATLGVLISASIHGWKVVEKE